jgi:hypothetical protein
MWMESCSRKTENSGNSQEVSEFLCKKLGFTEEPTLARQWWITSATKGTNKNALLDTQDAL